MRCQFIFPLVLILITQSNMVSIGETAIMKDRTPHPIIPLESYNIVDLKTLSANPRDYTWTQIHLEVRYGGLEKGIGYERMRYVGKNGKEPDNILLIITDTTQAKKNFLERLQLGDLLDLYCMVESTLSSGITIVMIEKIFLCN